MIRIDVAACLVKLIGFGVLVAITFGPGRSCAQGHEADVRSGLVLDVINADRFYAVVDGGHDEAVMRAPGDTVWLAPGPHTIVLASPRSADYSLDVELSRGAVVAKRVRLFRTSTFEVDEYLQQSAYPALQLGGNLLLRAAPDVELLLDGEPVGRGTVLIDTVAGSYEVTAVHPDAGRRTRAVRISDAGRRLHIVDLYVRPTKRHVVARSLVPGWAQLTKGDRRRSAAFFGTTMLLAGAAAQRHLRSKALRDELEATYRRLIRRYDLTATQEEALRLGDQIEERFRPVADVRRQRNALIGIAAAVYVLNVVDGLRRPEGGYRRPLPRVHPAMWSGQPGVTLSMQW